MWLLTPALLCAVLSASSGQARQAPLQEQQADALPGFVIVASRTTF